MTIYSQDYRKWEGEYRKRPYKLWGMIYFGIKRTWSSKWVKISIILAWIIPVFYIVLSLLSPMIIKESLKNGENSFFADFFSLQMLWSILLTATAGSSLISEDIESKSITLYYSSPIERIDYFLGKFGIIGCIISLITVLPSTVLYWVLVLILSLPVKGNLWIWGASLLNSVFLIIFLGILILFLSSLTKKGRYSGASFFGFIFGSGIVSAILYDVTKNKWMILLSALDDLDIIREKIFKITMERPIKWYYSFLVIAGITVLLGVFSFIRLKKLELSE